MNIATLAGIPAIQDPDATLWLLTGPSWAWFIQQALRHADSSILLSLYLLSPHWSRPRPGHTNLLAELCSAGQRLTKQGKLCRAVLGRPRQNQYTANYNLEAAAHLAAAGWAVRLINPPVMLHEKIVIIDDVIALVGSHNISKSSASSNLDTSLGIHSEKIATALKASWWTRWTQATRYQEQSQADEPYQQPEHPHRSAGSLSRDRRPARSRIL